MIFMLQHLMYQHSVTILIKSSVTFLYSRYQLASQNRKFAPWEDEPVEGHRKMFALKRQ